MIKTESEYKSTLLEYESQSRFIEEQLHKFHEAKMNKTQINLAIQPLHAFASNLKFELESYEKVKRGDFTGLEDFSQLGRLLIALRIFKQLKQKELADLLDVKESQVSRDEANEYHGASLTRIKEVLDALQVQLKLAPDYKVDIVESHRKIVNK